MSGPPLLKELGLDVKWWDLKANLSCRGEWSYKTRLYRHRILTSFLERIVLFSLYHSLSLSEGMNQCFLFCWNLLTQPSRGGFFLSHGQRYIRLWLHCPSKCCFVLAVHLHSKDIFFNNLFHLMMISGFVSFDIALQNSLLKTSAS